MFIENEKKHWYVLNKVNHCSLYFHIIFVVNKDGKESILLAKDEKNMFYLVVRRSYLHNGLCINIMVNIYRIS